MHPQTGVRGEKLKSTIKPYSWQPILSIGFIGTSFFFFFPLVLLLFFKFLGSQNIILHTIEVKIQGLYEISSGS